MSLPEAQSLWSTMPSGEIWKDASASAEHTNHCSAKDSLNVSAALAAQASNKHEQHLAHSRRSMRDIWLLEDTASLLAYQGWGHPPL